MAARLITTTARKKDISVRDCLQISARTACRRDHVGYSKANIAFHQALITNSDRPCCR
jgi:hypothetical protein